MSKTKSTKQNKKASTKNNIEQVKELAKKAAMKIYLPTEQEIEEYLKNPEPNRFSGMYPDEKAYCVYFDSLRNPGLSIIKLCAFNGISESNFRLMRLKHKAQWDEHIKVHLQNLADGIIRDATGSHYTKEMWESDYNGFDRELYKLSLST